MAHEKVMIEIKENGEITAKTEGIKGKKCMDFIEVLEELLEAEVIDSDFTEEYYETEQTMRHIRNQEIKGE